MDQTSDTTISPDKLCAVLSRSRGGASRCAVPPLLLLCSVGAPPGPLRAESEERTAPPELAEIPSLDSPAALAPAKATVGERSPALSDAAAGTEEEECLGGVECAGEGDWCWVDAGLGAFCRS